MSGKKLICVLGCHRSGTSLLARATHALGASLGDASTLMPGSYHNAKGYFENNRIVQINDAIFAAFGLSWKSLDVIPEEEQRESSKLRALHVEAVDLLDSALLDSPAFAFKDPRISRLLPFWSEVFSALDVTPQLALAVRHPNAVAESLRQRDGLPVMDALHLWAAYNIGIFSNCDPDWQMTVVDYDRMLGDPMREFGRLATGLGMPLDAAPKPRMSEFLLDFMDWRLNHNRDAGSMPVPAGKTSDVWEMLKMMAGR